MIFINAAGFFLIPIYTRYLQPFEFGILEIVNLCIEISNVIFTAGLGMASLSLYSKETVKTLQNEITSSAIFLAWGLSITGMICFFSFSKSLNHFFFTGSDSLDLFRLAGFVILVQVLMVVPMAYIQARMDSKRFVVISALNTLLVISLNIVTVVVLGMKVRGILLGNLIGTAVFGISLNIWTLKQTGYRLSKSIINKLLVFGIPFIPGGLLLFVMNSADRLFIQKLIDSYSVGVYSLGYKVGTLAALVVLGPFLKIWGPYMFTVDRELDGSESFGKYFAYVTVIYCIVGFAIALFSQELIKIIAPREYWGSYRVVPYVLVAYLFWTSAAFFDSGFYITQKTIYKPLIMSVAAGLIFLLYWFLIPPFGIFGGAYATMICFGVFSVLTYVLSNRIYPVKYPLKKPFFMLLLGIILYIFADSLYLNSIPLYLTIKIGLLVGYFFIMLMIGIFDRSDLRNIKAYLISLRGKTI